jgi:hypothetical protein
MYDNTCCNTHHHSGAEGISCAESFSPVPKVSPSSKAAVFKDDASKRDVKLSAVVWTVRIDIVVCPISLYRCKLVRYDGVKSGQLKRWLRNRKLQLRFEINYIHES